MKNLKMNRDVYSLRRSVIAIIHEAKELVPSLPRIEVRITEDDDKTLAFAYLNKNIIRVSQRAITDKEFDLRTVVFHELCHAVFGVRHIEECPLMKPIHEPISKARARKLFQGYAKRAGWNVAS